MERFEALSSSSTLSEALWSSVGLCGGSMQRFETL